MQLLFLGLKSHVFLQCKTETGTLTHCILKQKEINNVQFLKLISVFMLDRVLDMSNQKTMWYGHWINGFPN